MLTGKRIAIVGAAGLLGRQFCQAVAAAGGTVVAADLKLAAADELTHALPAARGNGMHRAFAVDIAATASVEALIASAAQGGRVDAVVNAAYPRNANYGRKFEDVAYADFCENLNLHLGGSFLVAQRFAEFFKRQGGGHIVNLASIYGIVAPRFEIYGGTPMTMPVEYAAIKAALIHLTRYIARYYRKEQVRANCISPGGILDGQPASFLTAYNELASPPGMLDCRDLDGLLVFLLSDGAAAINGQNLIVDNGFSL